MPHSKFRPFQSRDGSVWYVLYTPEHGPIAQIEGFCSEGDALEWIEHRAAAWTDDKESPGSSIYEEA